MHAKQTVLRLSVKILQNQMVIFCNQLACRNLCGLWIFFFLLGRKKSCSTGQNTAGVEIKINLMLWDNAVLFLIIEQPVKLIGCNGPIGAAGCDLSEYIGIFP